MHWDDLVTSSGRHYGQRKHLTANAETCRGQSVWSSRESRQQSPAWAWLCTPLFNYDPFKHKGTQRRLGEGPLLLHQGVIRGKDARVNKQKHRAATDI